MDIWAACGAAARPGPLRGGLVRLIENQEQVATRNLVDTLAEQVRLEELLERSKPPPPPGAGRLHYLLATPFRYPPLTHGSRFGSRSEPSLFYGSRQLPAALAEGAYYRFVFWHGMTAAPRSGQLTTQHTSFGADYKTTRGLRLQDPPFAAFEATLAAPDSYDATQRLGVNLREAGVEAIEFVSARSPRRGINVALFAPAAIASRRPRHQRAWLCQTGPETVSFSGRAPGTIYEFALPLFTVDGVLPQPAL